MLFVGRKQFVMGVAERGNLVGMVHGLAIPHWVEALMKVQLGHPVTSHEILLQGAVMLPSYSPCSAVTQVGPACCVGMGGLWPFAPTVQQWFYLT